MQIEGKTAETARSFGHRSWDRATERRSEIYKKYGVLMVKRTVNVDYLVAEWADFVLIHFQFQRLQRGTSKESQISHIQHQTHFKLSNNLEAAGATVTVDLEKNDSADNPPQNTTIHLSILH
jgi:hydrogenase maturation factor